MAHYAPLVLIGDFQTSAPILLRLWGHRATTAHVIQIRLLRVTDAVFGGLSNRFMIRVDVEVDYSLLLLFLHLLMLLFCHFDQIAG